MSELQKAIQELTYDNKKFPKSALEIVEAHRDEAIPILRNAIEKALKETSELENGYQLHFYALFLLGEFQDKEFFPKLMEFVSMPGDELDYLIGDTVTSGLKDILYNTYNGDVELLKNTILNEAVDEFVRADLLDVMGQLYLDGNLMEKEWRAFIRERVHRGKEYSYFYNALATTICSCHFVDMLPEIRYMLDYGLMDEMTLGKYDSCVDYMFEYRDDERNFCDTPIRTIDMLKHWAMYEEEDDSNTVDDEERLKAFEKLLAAGKNKPVIKTGQSKVGRNDPCPCGSGKKYKFCCLNKPQSPLDAIESEEERNQCLKEYPYTGDERQEDRIYLEDYFDSESIEIDKLLYLGLANRPGLIWNRNREQERNRCREYLTMAFETFVNKTEKENIHTFAEYDEKYSIHYFCKEWMGELLDLLKADGDRKRYQRVKACYKEMDQ